MPQLIFGGILAVILLGFYIWSIWIAVFVALGKYDVSYFSVNISYLLNTIGALISATVVGVLGATKSGDFPAQKTLEKGLTGMVQTFAGFMPSLFILAWIICGVIMVIFGFTYDFDPLTSQAKVWLGTAIGSVYAYFGITPNSNGNNGNQPHQPNPPNPPDE